ncbi:leukocyte elastase inhibitor-like isoform X2 [Periplaneta americana]|uniref:leukocyte elastase inhibitor-like isoform X2 n=1 Tax=Periplaneta americana TaxID=6978 RepID=UPI0037E9716E
MNAIVISLFLAVGVIAEDGGAPVNGETAQAITKFTVDMMKVLLEDAGSDNLVASPVSLSTVLAMVQQGAMGDTEKQLTKALYADPSENKEGYSKLTRNLRENSGNETLEFANGAFVNVGYEIEPNYNETLVKNFRSEMKTVNFANNVESADLINSWVSDHTHNRIKELISPDMLDALTRLVLVNAVYFKGLWTTPFRKEDTRDDTFYLSKDNTIQVPMMHLNRKQFKIGSLPELKASWISLPFEGDRFSTLVILPDEVDGLSALVEGITGDTLFNIIGSLNKTWPTEINLSFPKFKLESTLNLVEPLQKLGVQDLFTIQAQLGGISKEAVYVSDVVQKAEMEVDEEGATASAATGIISAGITSVGVREVLELKIDHPFLIFLLDGFNHLFLFSSKVSNPTKS